MQKLQTKFEAFKERMVSPHQFSASFKEASHTRMRPTLMLNRFLGFSIPATGLQTNEGSCLLSWQARRQLRQLQDAADFGGGQPSTEEQSSFGREVLGVLKSKTRRGGLSGRPSQPSAATNNENSEASGQCLNSHLCLPEKHASQSHRQVFLLFIYSTEAQQSYPPS